MKKGKAGRVYCINKEKLQEAIKATEEWLAELKDMLKQAEEKGDSND